MNKNGALIEIPTPSDLATPGPNIGLRLPAFMGGPADAAKRLASLRVLVVGIGSVGFEFTQQLARWQVQELALVDPKIFKTQNLLTTSISHDAVGQSKAFYAARWAKRLSPLTRVSAVQGRFESSINLADLCKFDVVFVATDGPLPELKVSQACRALGIQTVQSSVHGECLVCQVRFASHGGAEAPCAACAFTRDEWTHLNRRVFSCDGSAQPEGQPTMSLSALCSLAAQMGLLQFVRHLLELGEPVRDTVLEYCAYTHRTVQSRLARNPQCPCDHDVLRRVALMRPLPDCTLRELSAGDNNASLEIDSHVWVDQGRCECGAWRTHRRFVNGGSIGECGECRRPIRPHSFHSYRVVPAGTIDGDRPLRELGATDVRWAVVRSPKQATLFLNP